MLHELQRLLGQLRAARKTIDGLASTSAEARNWKLGAVKLPLLDQLLAAADTFLGNDRPFTFPGFAAGDEESATLSDASWVLAQYISCFEAHRARHLEKRHDKWFWVLEVEDDDGTKQIERIPVERYTEAPD